MIAVEYDYGVHDCPDIASAKILICEHYQNYGKEPERIYRIEDTTPDDKVEAEYSWKFEIKAKIFKDKK